MPNKQPSAASVDRQRRQPIDLGIDDGYACTKLALPDGHLLVIPSTARAGRSNVSWMPRAKQLIFEYETDGNVYSVGDIDAAPTRYDEYAFSGLNRVVVQHALQCADLEGVDVRAVSGLPVSAFYHRSGVRRADGIQRKRDSLKLHVRPASGAVSADIVEHDVIPEALAAWYDHVIQENNGAAALDPDQVARSIAVIDIGGRTTDTVVVLDQGIVHASSRSVELGLLDVQRSLGDRLEERFDLKRLEHRQLRRVMDTRSIRVFGRDYDVTAEIEAAKRELVERLRAEIHRQLGRGADLDCVLFVGGGALALRELISDWFPNQKTAHKPAFANARGMLKYRRYVHTDDDSADRF